MSDLIIKKCEHCGAIVKMIKDEGCDIVCCGEPMKILIPNSVDAAVEKHVPVIEKSDDDHIRIKVGSQPHPMEDKHYIEFIEAISPDGRYMKRKFLHPHEEPVMDFKCGCDKIKARELCNIHGLWSSEND